MRQRRLEAADWDADSAPADLELFAREILPAIRDIPLRQLTVATGLSLSYCALIRRGERVPHPRHWLSLKQAAL
jgi:hypothetical protein